MTTPRLSRSELSADVLVAIPDMTGQDKGNAPSKDALAVRGANAAAVGR